MKRKQNILDIVRKIKSLKQETDEKEAWPTFLNDAADPSVSDALLQTRDEVDKTSALPDCWSTEQYEKFKKKYDGLIVRSKKLGCVHCAQYDSIKIHMKGMHVSMEWAGCSVIACGKEKPIQQASLRKKMTMHFSSKAHEICVKELRDRADNSITKCVDELNLNQNRIDSTRKMFNTVYSFAKRSRPFSVSDVRDEIELQIKNGVDMGAGLRSRETVVKIVDHIAKEIRNEIFTKIIEQNSKICVILDETSTISRKSLLLIFLKIENCDLSPTMFLDLIELEGQGGEAIYTSLLNCLYSAGFDFKYLRNNLIAFCSDGASVMLGRHSGVGTRLKNDFPNIIIWHCLNHRLPLVLDDSVIELKQVNHFKIFMEKIFTIVHQSNKNQMELFEISEELGQQILKIGRDLGPRWAACSLRSALAVWHAYPALYTYFSTGIKHSGMTARLCNKYFLADLSLMIDVLQEMALLSNGLQVRSVSLPRAEKLIKRSIKALEMLKESKGTFEKEIIDRISSDAFKDIQFIEDHRFVSLPRQRLLEVIIENMKNLLMDCDHLTSRNNDKPNTNQLHELLNLFDPDTWNIEEVVVPWKAAEDKLNEFSKQFHHDIPINDFRDFVENVLRNKSNHTIPQSVQKARRIVSTIAVSSAEVERGITRMNIIYSDLYKSKRSLLTVENVSNLMTIYLNGLPLDSWDATPSAKSWLSQNHSYDEDRVKNKKTTRDNDYDDNQVAIWTFLKGNKSFGKYFC